MSRVSSKIHAVLHADAKAYDIKWLDAIEADYKGGKIFSVPAPASGAMFISALGLLSTFEHEGEGSDIDLHRTTEAMKVSSTS